MVDFTHLAVAGIQGLEPYQAGKPESELKRELGLESIIKLASNENPNGPDPRVIDELPGLLSGLSRYPDSNGFELKQILSERLVVECQQITLGNGSNDILDLVARVFLQPGRNAVMSRHAFAIYGLVTRSVGAEIKLAEPANDDNFHGFAHDLDNLFHQVDDQTAVVFIANPNNPTGTYLPYGQLKHFVECLPPQVICVVDEAYFEYVVQDDYRSVIELVQQFPNLIMTRTFSKAYGLAGLRVGYAVSSVMIAELMNRVRQPFNINSLGIAAATLSVQDNCYIESSKLSNQSGLRQLEDGLKALNLNFIPSVGNFISVKLDQPVQTMYQALLRHGVIIRPIENYQMPGYVRVSVGTESENSFFLNVLDKLLRQ
ncbi:MAG: histidinol-phosphate transaminase [Gammaproteobacteria bacterium]|nr:histidinol-phosphate transaminase [Gammaproteobacteria bacterium]